MNYLNGALPLNDIGSVGACSCYKLIKIQESNEFGVSNPTGWPVVHTGALTGRQRYLPIPFSSTNNQ